MTQMTQVTQNPPVVHVACPRVHASGSSSEGLSTGSSDPDFALAGGRFIWLIHSVRLAVSVHGSFLALPMRVIRTALRRQVARSCVTEMAAREVV